jgi:SAM-dependent methyltransferase
VEFEMSSFEINYARFYDYFHANKNYLNEAKSILNLLPSNYFEGKRRTIFDFGCGTGLHLDTFNSLGFEIEGYDKSEAMIRFASERNKNGKFSTNLADFDSQVGLSLSLFDVASYQTTTKALTEMIEIMSSRLQSGGFLVLDTWQAEGILLDPPSESSRTVQVGQEIFRRLVRPIREVESELGASSKLFELEVTIEDLQGCKIVSSEIHKIRPWSRLEVRTILRNLNLTEVSLFNPKTFGLSQPSDWRIGIVAAKP